MLTPNLSEPLQVLHKLEREMHRSFHHRNYTHKADHFYNFCVTATSLRDFVLNHLDKKSDTEKQPFWDEWSNVECLNAAKEIGNTSKHCKLKKTPKTKAFSKSRSVIVNVLIGDGLGEIREVPENAPDYTITFSDGSEVQLFEFARAVIEYWKGYLEKIGIQYIQQDEHTYFGDPET